MRTVHKRLYERGQHYTMPVLVRVSATDWAAGGWDLDQTVELAKILKSASGRLRSSARLLKNGSAVWSVSNAERHRACKTVICMTTHFPMITGKTH